MEVPSTDQKPPVVILVEDNEADVELFRMAVSPKWDGIEVLSFPRGDAALQELMNRSDTEDDAQPRLVIVDLNMPGMSGREFLSRLTEMPNLSLIPTVVFSCSWANRDIRECLALGAKSYVVKPMEYRELVRQLDVMLAFWLRVATAIPNAGVARL